MALLELNLKAKREQPKADFSTASLLKAVAEIKELQMKMDLEVAKQYINKPVTLTFCDDTWNYAG